jgi:hypothetical protein
MESTRWAHLEPLRGRPRVESANLFPFRSKGKGGSKGGGKGRGGGGWGGGGGGGKSVRKGSKGCK